MRDLAKFVGRQVDQAAARTAAFDRATVIGTNPDGSVLCSYKGHEVTLEGAGLRLTEGQAVEVVRSNGRLSLSGLSPYV